MVYDDLVTKAVVLSLFLFLIGITVLATLRAISLETINLVESVEITQTVKIGEPDQQLTVISGEIITNQGLSSIPFRSFPGKVNIHEIVLRDEPNPLVEKDADLIAFLKRRPEIVYVRRNRMAIFRLKEKGKTIGTFIDLSGYSQEELGRWEDYAALD